MVLVYGFLQTVQLMKENGPEQKKMEVTVREQLPKEFVRAAGETRTPDLGITNASLYQLSYSG